MVVEQCKAIIKVCPKIYDQQPKKTRAKMCCALKRQKTFFKDSGNSVSFGCMQNASFNKKSVNVVITLYSPNIKTPINECQIVFAMFSIALIVLKKNNIIYRSGK